MTNVVMPQMGESIAEGTIVRWIKKVGDSIDRDEPLFEISTDKVDAEIPSPAAGVLTEIKVKEGETVAVNSVVATIGDAGEASRRRQRDRAEPRCRSAAAGQPEARSPSSRRPSGKPARSRTKTDDAGEPRGRAPASEIVAAGAAHRPGAQRRHLTQIHGTGIERPGHQAGHPRLHRAGKASEPALRRQAAASPAAAPRRHRRSSPARAVRSCR